MLASQWLNADGRMGIQCCSRHPFLQSWAIGVSSTKGLATTLAIAREETSRYRWNALESDCRETGRICLLLILSMTSLLKQLSCQWSCLLFILIFIFAGDNGALRRRDIALFHDCSGWFGHGGVAAGKQSQVSLFSTFTFFLVQMLTHLDFPC